jgi:uncharacterized protein YbjT (DUF2867 family)
LHEGKIRGKIGKNMNGQTAVLVGATGLVGSLLLQKLLSDNAFSKVIALTRKLSEIPHRKLVNKVVDFNNREELFNSFETADVIFCCVGTTQKKVNGDESAYRKVDFDIPVSMGNIGIQKGVKQFVFVSSIGANIHSNNFFLRLKGEIEQAISELGYQSLYIIRPSMLLGKRSEYRLGENIGQAVMRSASFLFFGAMKKYYPVQASDVADAMLKAAIEKRPGINIIQYDEMVQLISHPHLQSA